MAKAARPQAAPRSKSGGGFLLGVFIGLVIGLGAAIGVAFYLNKAPVPFVTKSKPPAAKEADGKAPAVAALPPGSTPAAKDASPPAKAAEKPRFDFYKILPGGEEPVSDKELKGMKAAAKEAKGSPPGPLADLYFLQAGSFQNPADADNQKAKIAILGLESNVEPSVLPDKGTWYRVRLGPYRRLDEINKTRATLAQNGIEASLVKVKDPARSN
jgi:cell division protein FtsN